MDCGGKGEGEIIIELGIIGRVAYWRYAKLFLQSFLSGLARLVVDMRVYGRYDVVRSDLQYLN